MAIEQLVGPAILAVAAAFALTPAFLILGRRLGYVDIPGQRSSHLAPTPRTGGFAIVGALVTSTSMYWSDLAPLIVGIGAIVLLAALDDVKALHRGVRLFGQCLIAIGAVASASFESRNLGLSATGESSLEFLAFVLSVVWLVAMINAYNFMDGINGIAGVQAVVAGAALTILFARVSDEPAAAVSLAAAAAAIGFLPWNFPRAGVFMGDVGSTALGFLFGALVLRAAFDGIPFVVAALPFTTFLLDSGATIALRIYRKEAFFSTPHRIHFYQRLVAGGWSHVAVTLTWGLVALGDSLFAVAFMNLSLEQRLISVTLLLAVHVGIALAISVRWPLPRHYRTLSE